MIIDVRLRLEIVMPHRAQRNNGRAFSERREFGCAQNGGGSAGLPAEGGWLANSSRTRRYFEGKCAVNTSAHVECSGIITCQKERANECGNNEPPFSAASAAHSR